MARDRNAVSLVYETHAISTDNLAGRATGWNEGVLAPEGRASAEQLGERRRNDGLAAVFASDLGRAVETAKIAFVDSRIPIFFDRRLREANYGKLNGAPVAKFMGRRREHVRAPFPGGQSYRDVVEGMRAFLDELARDWAGRRVLIIGHSATRWSLDHLLKGIPLEDLVDAPFEWREGWEYELAGTMSA